MDVHEEASHVISEKDTAITELCLVLRGIINHCVHPDVAVRAVMVDLGPIRQVLQKYGSYLIDTNQ